MTAEKENKSSEKLNEVDEKNKSVKEKKEKKDAPKEEELVSCFPFCFISCNLTDIIFYMYM